jgi:ribonuclease HI
MRDAGAGVDGGAVAGIPPAATSRSGRTKSSGIAVGLHVGRTIRHGGARMAETPTIVFADGAAKGNPGPGGWGVIVVTSAGEVHELGGGERHTTNNRMELTAALEALRHLGSGSGPVAVYTDSAYVIRGIRDWIHNWRRRGWRSSTGSDVLNRDLWEALAAAEQRTGDVTWHYVPGHSGVPGNERADEIADAWAVGKRPALYRGPLIRYAVAVHDIPDDTRVPERSSGTRSSARRSAPHSYLSLVDGQPARHATWAECERRVKGRSGARFKKAMTAAEEEAILRSWGFSPDDVA